MIQTTIRNLKIGQYFQLKDDDSSPIWIRNHYDKTFKKFCATSCDDINRTREFKGDKVVYVDETPIISHHYAKRGY